MLIAAIAIPIHLVIAGLCVRAAVVRPDQRRSWLALVAVNFVFISEIASRM